MISGNTALPLSQLMRLSRVFIISAIVFELAALWFVSHKPELVPLWRVLHLVQMLLLIALTWASKRQLQHQQSNWASASNLVLAALCISLVGDMINSRLIDLNALFSPQTVLSIPPFAIAQMLYVALFWQSYKRPKQASDSPRFRQVGLLVWLPLAAALWSTVFSSSLPPVMLGATVFYTALVVLMGVTSTWIWRSWGATGITICIGALLFLTSDAMIGHAMSSGNSPSGFSGHVIWLLYIVAQCLIARLPVLGELSDQQHRKPN